MEPLILIFFLKTLFFQVYANWMLTKCQCKVCLCVFEIFISGRCEGGIAHLVKTTCHFKRLTHHPRTATLNPHNTSDLLQISKISNNIFHTLGLLAIFYYILLGKPSIAYFLICHIQKYLSPSI